MWILVSAIVTASLLGSMHCVGMCGPLAIWASGAGQQQSRRRVQVAASLYHLGRLLTFTLAGVIAGAIGSVIDASGSALGVQILAARVVGAAMVIVGAIKLVHLMLPARQAAPAAPSKIGGLLVKLRPHVMRLPLAGRALAIGMLTTLLPCGWLYLFALVAAGTGSPLLGAVVMASFWVGTVPALVALVAGTQALSYKFTRMVPAAAAVLLILTGCYTASGRGFAQLQSLTALEARFQAAIDDKADAMTGLLQQVQRAPDQPLPCCREDVTPPKSASEPDVAPGPDVVPGPELEAGDSTSPAEPAPRDPGAVAGEASEAARPTP